MVFDELVTGAFSSPFPYEFWPALDDQSRKLMIVLHGRGDSGAGFHWLPEQLGRDDLAYLFLQAPDPYGPGYSWYGLPPNQGPGVERTRAGMFALLESLSALSSDSSLF